jgi:hypothetical protein
MDFYDMLERLVDNSTMGEPNQKAAREVIKTLKGVNAFGTVVAGSVSESQEPPHVHQKETRWDTFNQGKLIDICRVCDEKLSPPYDASWQGRKW